MRFSISILCAWVVMLVVTTLGAIPAFSNPVYVHARTHKAHKHKVPKHRSVQG